MSGRLRQSSSNEKGGIAVLLAVAAMVLFGMAALVVDAGLLYLDRARLTTAVDAAGLAGAQELPLHPGRAVETALNYGSLNQITDLQAEVLPGGKTLEVRAKLERPLLFGRFLGQNWGEVSARAVAMVAPLGSAIGVAPFGVEEHQLKDGVRYVLKQPAGTYESPLGSGNYGALSIGGSGASRYEENLRDGYKGVLRVGDRLATETGNMSGPTKRALDIRIDSCPDGLNCSVESFSRNCKHLLVVPIFKKINGSIKQIKEVEIVGFAPFHVDKVEGNGNESTVYGYFVPNLGVGSPDPTLGDYGFRGVILVQ